MSEEVFSCCYMGIFPPSLVCFFHPFLLDWSPLTSALSGRDEELIFPRQVCGKRNQGLTSKRAGGPWGQADAPLAEVSSRDDDTDRAVSLSLWWEGGRDVTGVLISIFTFCTLSLTTSPIIYITLYQQGDAINALIFCSLGNSPGKFRWRITPLDEDKHRCYPLMLQTKAWEALIILFLEKTWYSKCFSINQAVP